MAQTLVPRSGVDSHAIYGAETTYGTAATTIESVFGIIQNISPTNRRNLKQVRGTRGTTVSGRTMLKALGGKFETTLSIEFQPSHFDWLKYVIGSRTGAGTSASKYIYAENITGTTTGTTADKLVDSAATFDSDTLVGLRVWNTTDSTETTISAVDSGTQLTVRDDIFASGEGYNIVVDRLTSLTVSINTEMGATDRKWNYLGMKVNSCTIRAAVDEPIAVTLELMGADVDQATTLETPQANDTADVYHFSGSTLEYPNASVISNIIDTIEITITHNVEVLYGLGSYTGQGAIEKAREYSIKFTMKTLDNTFTDDFLGSASGVDAPTEVATIEVNFAGATNHTAAFLFSNCTLDEWADNQSWGEAVPEEFTAVCETLQVTEQQTA